MPEISKDFLKRMNEIISNIQKNRSVIGHRKVQWGKNPHHFTTEEYFIETGEPVDKERSERIRKGVR